MDRRILHTDSGHSRRHAQHVQDSAAIHRQRTGQMLFNTLNPTALADQVRGKPFDPFYKQLTLDQLKEWIDDHIVFDDHGHMIALFDGYEVLWERERN